MVKSGIQIVKISLNASLNTHRLHDISNFLSNKFRKGEHYAIHTAIHVDKGIQIFQGYFMHWLNLTLLGYHGRTVLTKLPQYTKNIQNQLSLMVVMISLCVITIAGMCGVLLDWWLVGWWLLSTGSADCTLLHPIHNCIHLLRDVHAEFGFERLNHKTFLVSALNIKYRELFFEFCYFRFVTLSKL